MAVSSCSVCVHKDRCLLKRIVQEHIVRMTRPLDREAAVSVYNMTTFGIPYREVINPNSTPENVDAAVAAFKSKMENAAYTLIGPACLSGVSA